MANTNIKLGMPYYSTRIVRKRAFGVCPFCQQYIALVERKDWESYSGVEMHDHYKASHPEKL